MKEIFVSNIHKWQASPENPKEKPKLEFVDALFKRRLSQCTRMTIQVLHDLLEEFPDAKDLKQVLKYAENKDKTNLENETENVYLVTGVNCNKDTVYQEMIKV